MDRMEEIKKAIKDKRELIEEQNNINQALEKQITTMGVEKAREIKEIIFDMMNICKNLDICVEFETENDYYFQIYKNSFMINKDKKTLSYFVVGMWGDEIDILTELIETVYVWQEIKHSFIEGFYNQVSTYLENKSKEVASITDSLLNKTHYLKNILKGLIE